MFSDPFTVRNHTTGTWGNAFDGGETHWSMPAISRGPDSSLYRYVVDTDTHVDLFVGHQFGKRNRFTMRFTESDVVANPMDTSKNVIKTSSLYVVADYSLLGNPANHDKFQDAMAAFLFKGNESYTFLDRVLKGET